jgi:hypothetical protein
VVGGRFAGGVSGGITAGGSGGVMAGRVALGRVTPGGVLAPAGMVALLGGSTSAVAGSVAG